MVTLGQFVQVCFFMPGRTYSSNGDFYDRTGVEVRKILYACWSAGLAGLIHSRPTDQQMSLLNGFSFDALPH
jgi:hypothetical protein